MMKISVVVPVRNEENTIRKLVGQLLEQSRPPAEIVITDGGSSDSTREIINDYVAAGAPVKLIRARAALPGRGRNMAAAAANCEWLAFIDAGIEPARNWIELLAAKAEQDPTIDVVYGAWEPVTDTFFTECAAITYVPPPAPRSGTVARPRSIASSLMRRSVWQSVGGFRETLRSGEDLLFMDQIERAGFNCVFEPGAVVRWQLRPSLVSTFKRFVVYARNNIRAGLWKQWQGTIFTRYLVLLVIAITSLAISPTLLWLPIALWLLMLLARAIVAIRRNRLCYPATFGRNGRRLLVLMPLIATIDAAAIIGSIQWLFLDWLRGNGKATVEAGNGA